MSAYWGVCNSLKEHVVANSVYVVTVNGRGAPKCKFWAKTENSGCAWSNRKCFVTIYFIK